MRSGVTIVAGLLAGVLVAFGILAALVFVGPDPVGLRPTPSPSAQPSLVAVASPSLSPSASASGLVASGGPSGSAGPGGSASPSEASQAGFHVGETAPPLVVPQLGGGTIDLANLRGKAVWLNFMQTTCPECVDEFPVMDGFKAAFADKGLVVIAVDIREDEGTVAAFAARLNTTFPIGLDGDGTAQRAWGTYALPIHFWVDKGGIVRAGALGGVGRDIFAAGLTKILGVTVTP
jgi:thiol-disulfide isomerase/thioredoxin